MSRKERHDNDAYYTHRPLIKALLDHVPIKGVVCEPCAGEGHITKTLYLANPDLIVRGFDLTAGWDATEPRNWANIEHQWGTVDWTVTNPPYRQPDCQKIIDNAWMHSKVGIAMLLRLSYLEPCNGRAKFLQNIPLSHLLVFNPRPQFRTDTSGTDSCTVAWFVWQKEWADNTQVIYVTDWR